MNLDMADGVAQAELVARGDVAPSELFAACLERIERWNPLLRAVVTVQRERGRPPRAKPFSGVPFLAKDSLSWPGLRWSMGARMLASNVAEQHTAFGRRLVDAGLVLAGKTAMSELGLLASTETLLEGVTHNPWDLSRSAGGSSGGSAAAVAAGIVPLAHASDGGGSIRVPASMCGVFGFKPSRGRTVSAWLASDDFVDMTADHCVTRSVRDSARFLAITQELAEPEVREPSRARLRIGAWTRAMTGDEPAPEVRAAFERTIALLESLGHRVEVMDGPVYDPALAEAFYTVAGASVRALVGSIDARRPVQHDELEPFTWSLMRGAGALADARGRFAEASRAYRELQAPYDVTLTPTLASLPP
ncbi:MAG: amidase, partial [Sandaracinaceae bacterium]|nr:amidase [Sandaracinaceae bacterium]